MAHWLGLSTLTARGQGSIPDQELRSLKLHSMANNNNKIDDITNFLERYNLELTRRNRGISLVAHWLRLRAPNAGGQVRSLVKELDPACMPQLRPGAAK